MTHSAFRTATQTREILTLAYIRLSDDNDGTMRSPETQWRGIVRIAERLNLPVPPPERVFTDRNLSASDSNVIRFDYERMLKLIDSVDTRRYEIVVLAYAQDRVFRQPADWQHFTELVGPANCDGRLITDFEGSVDLGAMGIFAAGAGYVEAKKTAKRSKDGITGAAMEGRGHGTVPYGWTREYDHSGTGKPKSTTVIVQTEAKVIRDAAARILAGDSLRAICADLNAGGIPAPGANRVRRRDPITREPVAFAPDEWLPQKLRQILLRVSNKGIREHTSGKGARKTTTYHKAEWDAILPDDVFDMLADKLNDPARRTTTSNTAKYLVSGIATCGKLIDGKPCGLPVAGRVSYKGKARTRYAAYTDVHGHVVKSIAATDMVIETEVLHMLSQPEIRSALAPKTDADTTGALEREAALLARKDAAADDYATGLIDRAMMARVAAGIDRQLEEIRASIRATQDASVYAELLDADPTELEAIWEGYSVSYRRSVVRALFNIALLPNPRYGKSAFDPTTIVITLRPMRGE